MKKYQPVFVSDNYEDKQVLIPLNRIFKRKRNYIIKIPLKRSPVILLVSGGIDSICLWYLLLKKYQLQVYPIYLYSKKRQRPGQVKAVKTFSQILKKQFPQLFQEVKYINSYCLGQTSKFKPEVYFKELPSLTANLNQNLNKKDKYNLIYAARPVRMNFYLYHAFQHALFLQTKNVKLHTFFLGIVPDDGYLCRESTLTSIRSANLNFCLVLGDWRWQAIAPVEKAEGFYYTRDKLITFAQKGRLPLVKTWSCDRNWFKQCGACPSCYLRKASFQKHKVKDSYLLSPKLIALKGSFLAKKRKLIKTISQFLFYTPKKGQKPIQVKKLTNKVFFISADTQWQKIGNKIVLLNDKSGELVELNTTASILWCQLGKSKKTNFSQLLNALKLEYDVNEKKLCKDLSTFLEQFVTQGYLDIQRNKTT